VNGKIKISMLGKCWKPGKNGIIGMANKEERHFPFLYHIKWCFPLLCRLFDIQRKSEISVVIPQNNLVDVCFFVSKENSSMNSAMKFLLH
jgi:hypothetical protein